MSDAPRIRLPYPHPGQRVILSSPARFKWVAAGRRWRKTTMALHPVVEGALRGQEIIWGAPTYDQCRTGWEELQHAAGGSWEFREQRMEATAPGGGRVLFRSLDDPNNARSKTAQGFVMDEAAYCHPSAWPEVIRPILSDTGGWALLISTPRGRNWFWERWVAAKQDSDSDAWTAPTLGVAVENGVLVRRPHPLENPEFPFEEAEKLYRTQPERVFRQEFLGEFIEGGAGVFRRVREAAVATPQDRRVGEHEYAIGADWGKHEDFTVFAVVDLHLRSCVALERLREIDYMVQLQRLQNLVARFRPRRIIAERNAAGEPLVEHLQRLGLPVMGYQSTSESKRTAIEALSLAFERGDIKILPDETLLAELEAFQAERLPSGLLRYGAPPGMHDDCVIALAMAWQAVADTPPPRDVKIPQPSWGRR
jgi:phage terminase large subunit-like protein